MKDDHPVETGTPVHGSPFVGVSRGAWLASNELAFAIFDRFPASQGHSLVVTRRVVPDWEAASAEERTAVMALVDRVLELLRIEFKPDGFNVGFNLGASSGQTIEHLHVHVIPRYAGDVVDPTGGVRNVIPGKGNYLR